MAKKKSKKVVKTENLIHIKLEYEEAKQGKRDFLSSEANLLQLMKIINNYKKFRAEELKKKIEITKKSKELRLNINKLITLLPKYKLPEILKKEDEEKISVKENKHKTPQKVIINTLDSQLEEIQRKLKILQEK